MDLPSEKWVFIPGITGGNSALRCIADDPRFEILDLPRKLTAESSAKCIVQGINCGSVPRVVIGNSYGALVALHVARLLPGVVSHVVLVNPPLNPLRARSLEVY